MYLPSNIQSVIIFFCKLTPLFSLNMKSCGPILLSVILVYIWNYFTKIVTE